MEHGQTGLPENKDSRVNGVGGKQAVGQAQTCSFVLDCLPKKVFQHPLKPTKIPGEPALVLLGTDFLSKFDEFRIDWANHRMKLGTDWVYTASQESRRRRLPSWMWNLPLVPAKSQQ